jgi:starch-binding outer membrane protein, SusD/RagB family
MSRHTMQGVALCAALLVAACDGLLDVTNPGPINDNDLNTVVAMPALVAGMSGDLSEAHSTTTIWGSVWSDDLTHSGTLGAPTIFARGVIAPIDVNPWWASAQRARWVAEHGIERMKDVLKTTFETSALTPRAYLHAGYANRILGENTCNAVIDGGPAQDHKEHFTRAEGHFTEALRIASAQNATAFANAALAGRAQVRAALGNWSGAAQDAAQVPIAFRYDAVYSLNTSREGNGWRAVTLTRGEYSVWATRWYEESDDPRIPWANVLTSSGNLANAANGVTPWVRQQKYLDDAANIPLAKGTEMLLIRAEAALRGGDVPQAMAFINQVRTHHALGNLTATSVEAAWPILQDERGKTLWLEGRRFWDLRRWNAEAGAARNSFLDGKDNCVPISENERLTNPNIR